MESFATLETTDRVEDELLSRNSRSVNYWTSNHEIAHLKLAPFMASGFRDMANLDIE